MGAKRLPATIDAQNVVRTVPAEPLRLMRFDAHVAKDLPSLARALEQMQRAFVAATDAARRNLRNNARVFLNRKVTSGQTISFRHDLGRPAHWAPIGWRGATAEAKFWEASNDSIQITFNVRQTGIVDMEIF